MKKGVWEALSDKTRRKILNLLKTRARTAGEIAKEFSLSAATVSHHLSVLKESGLVECERHAQTLCYSLNTTVVQEILKNIADLFGVEGA
jgi:DNA-binding transcriptional ArsR family regulator